MRHALEPDHLAAVSTLITTERNHARAAWLGACWGLGHTMTLLVAGGALIVARTEMPDAASTGFELLVALMLVTLGLRSIYLAAREGTSGPSHLHRHGAVVHAHAGAPAHVHVGRWTLARRPLLMGAVHGLAGSGALTPLVLAVMPSTAARLAYMALFGLGSTVGMAALSGTLGYPLGRLARHPALARAMSLTVGCVTTALGLWWGYPLVGRLF
jgi:hypothetical protein